MWTMSCISSGLASTCSLAMAMHGREKFTSIELRPCTPSSRMHFDFAATKPHRISKTARAPDLRCPSSSPLPQPRVLCRSNVARACSRAISIMPTWQGMCQAPCAKKARKMQKRSECPNGLRARRNAAKSAVRSAPLLRAPDRRAQIPLSLLRLCESPLQRSEGRAMRARLPGKRGSPSRSREGDPTCAYICFFEPLARAAQTEGLLTSRPPWPSPPERRKRRGRRWPAQRDLAVDVHASDLQAVDHARIAQAVDAGRGVDAGDPQATEVALFLLAADIGIAKANGEPARWQRDTACSWRQSNPWPAS